MPQAYVRDNVGAFIESSNTPKARWSTAKVGRASDDPHTDFPYRDLFYLIDYVPPDPTPGKCHQIKVKVGRSHSYVYARSQYCNTEVAPSDPLGGTQLGEELAAELASTQTGNIDLSFQTGVFYTTTGDARVEVALEFPYDSLKRKRDADGLVATIGIIGAAYSTDGSPVQRFSELGCCPADHPRLSSDTGKLVSLRDPFDYHEWIPASGGLSPSAVEVGPNEKPYPKDLDIFLLPAGYETQLNLPAGQYTLKVALSDGSNFGRVETPLGVDAYDAKHLSLSSVLLCKRFRDALAASQNAAAVKLSPEFVPLVSKGLEFTTAGDTRFKKGEALIVYFEVYEPQPAAAPATGVQTRLRVSDAKTGEVKIDTGLENVDASTQPGSTVIPIAKQVSVDKLPAGAYRLEVQATDPTCECTVLRAANFTVE